MTARPVVGSVTRERILSNVLFPEPFVPMTPKTSPFLISNETSRKAHKLESAGGGPTRRPTNWRMRRESAPARELSCAWDLPNRYCLDKPSTVTAASSI